MTTQNDDLAILDQILEDYLAELDAADAADLEAARRLLDVRSDVREIGSTEDGPAFETVFFVQASTLRGEVFGHDHSFATRDEAQALLEKIAAHLARGGRLSPARWSFLRYSYGSRAFVENDGDLGLMDDEERFHKARLGVI